MNKYYLETLKLIVVMTLFLVAGGIRMSTPGWWGITYSLLHVFLGIVLFNMWFETKEVRI